MPAEIRHGAKALIAVMAVALVGFSPHAGLAQPAGAAARNAIPAADVPAAGPCSAPEDVLKEQCDPEHGASVRLDAPGGPLQFEPTRDTLDLDDCYAIVAAVLIDAFLAKYDPKFNPAHPVSALWLALNAPHRPDLGPWKVAYKPKPELKDQPHRQFEFFFEGGDEADALRAGVDLATGGLGGKWPAPAAPSGPAAGFCDIDTTESFSSKQQVVRYWQGAASEAERSEVLHPTAGATGAGSPHREGPVPAMDAFRSKINQLCASKKPGELNNIIDQIQGDNPIVPQARSFPNTSLQIYKKAIDQVLSIGLPAGVGICEDHLIDGRFEAVSFTAVPPPLRARPNCRLHAVVVAGRRFSPTTHRLEYLVINSWGNNCLYPPRLQANCDPATGRVWVDARDLLSITIEVTAFFGIRPKKAPG